MITTNRINYGEISNIMGVLNVNMWPPHTGNADLFQFCRSLLHSGVGISEFIDYINTTCGTRKMRYDDLQNELLKYIITTKQYDFGCEWYGHIHDTLNVVNYRYTRQKIVGKHTLTHYKIFFKVYCTLVNEGIYTEADDLNSVFYFIAAQYSCRYHRGKGLLAKVVPETLKYKMAVDQYMAFKRQGYPPSMIRPYMCYIFHKGAAPYYEYKPWELDQRDQESSSYVSTEIPVLQMSLPMLSKFNLPQLRAYLQELEYLMIRASFKGRMYNKFVLGVEHIRTYTHANNTFPNAFSSQ